MRAGLLGARAHIRLPISKMMIEAKKTARREKYLYALPQTDWKAARARKKAEPYHPTSARELNSDVILGIAVAMMLCTGSVKGKLYQWRGGEIAVALQRQGQSKSRG